MSTVPLVGAWLLANMPLAYVLDWNFCTGNIGEASNASSHRTSEICERPCESVLLRKTTGDPVVPLRLSREP